MLELETLDPAGPDFLAQLSKLTIGSSDVKAFAQALSLKAQSESTAGTQTNGPTTNKPCLSEVSRMLRRATGAQCELSTNINDFPDFKARLERAKDRAKRLACHVTRSSRNDKRAQRDVREE